VIAAMSWMCLSSGWGGRLRVDVVVGVEISC
jgi:hypothetical protein